MGFKEAIQSVFKNYANFKGRARRSEYWYWTLFNMIVTAIITGANSGLANLLVNAGVGQFFDTTVFESSLSFIWFAVTFIPSLAVCVRRLHDIGKSGWCVLLSFIPIVGAIILLVWECRDSVPMPNEYGDSPKYPFNPMQYGAPYQPQQPNYAQPQPNQPGNYYAPQQNYYQPSVQPVEPQQQTYYAPQPPVEQAPQQNYYVPQEQPNYPPTNNDNQ